MAINYFRFLAIFLVLLSGSTGVVTATDSVLVGKAVPTPTPKPPEQDRVARIRKTFPVVEYAQNPPADPIRTANSSKYGSVKILDPNIYENSMEAVSNDWEVGLTALPVRESQVIVRGKISHRAAYLSANMSDVYSEFTINAEKFFKPQNSRKLPDLIRAERWGGIVKFPSGFEKWFFVNGQRMPEEGKEYVFFLSNNAASIGLSRDDLFILTAYEIQPNGMVAPLDYPGGGTHPIAATYLNKPVSSLLIDLEVAIKNVSADRSTSVIHRIGPLDSSRRVSFIFP